MSAHLTDPVGASIEDALSEGSTTVLFPTTGADPRPCPGLDDHPSPSARTSGRPLPRRTSRRASPPRTDLDRRGQRRDPAPAHSVGTPRQCAPAGARAAQHVDDFESREPHRRLPPRRGPRGTTPSAPRAPRDCRSNDLNLPNGWRGDPAVPPAVGSAPHRRRAGGLAPVKLERAPPTDLGPRRRRSGFQRTG